MGYMETVEKGMTQIETIGAGLFVVATIAFFIWIIYLAISK